VEIAPLIRDLAVILCVAGLVSLLFHKIRQPVVLGYILAGMIVGPNTPPFPLVKDIPSIQTWAELGVIFLMFSLGLEFSFRKLAAVGFSAALTACFEVVIMIALGFATGRILGWSTVDSIFLGAMLSISSTTIIIRALDELKLKTRRFAEMIFAVLIVEDLVAILVLVGLSTFVIEKSFSGLLLLTSAFKLILVVGGWFLAGYLIVPRFVRYVGLAGSNEMLTLISVGLCLALVVFATTLQYSSALGAFIMGSILAESTESQRIEERLESLRDLFSAIFFVSIGMLINPKTIFDNFGAIVLITLVTVVGKVLTTTLGSLITGQTLRTSLQVGFGLAQIGEFSFIIAGLGQSLEVTSSFLYPIGVGVSLITTFLTPYMIRISHDSTILLEDRIPLKIKAALDQYATWIRERQVDREQKKEFRQFIGQWLINLLSISLVFVLSTNYILPFFEDRFGPRLWIAAASWTFTVVLASPFIWGMWAAIHRYSSSASGPSEIARKTARVGVVLFFRLTSVIWLGALSLGFFPPRYIIFVVGFVAIGLVGLFYRQIEVFYRWFEDRFLSTFEMNIKTKSTPNVLRHLAPWDAHLVRIKVHPNSEICNQSLKQAKIRSRVGLNIVIIQRGIKTIVAPTPDEVLLSGDELLVLATDEQLDAAKALIEYPQHDFSHVKAISEYSLKPLRVPVNSPFDGKSIRTLGIGEIYKAILVGIERGDQRIMNPESEFMIRGGDILWLVGNHSQLQRLLSELE